MRINLAYILLSCFLVWFDLGYGKVPALFFAFHIFQDPATWWNSFSLNIGGSIGKLMFPLGFITIFSISAMRKRRTIIALAYAGISFLSISFIGFLCSIYIKSWWFTYVGLLIFAVCAIRFIRGVNAPRKEENT